MCKILPDCLRDRVFDKILILIRLHERGKFEGKKSLLTLNQLDY